MATAAPSGTSAATPPAKGDDIVITSEGVHVFEGKVASVSGGVGERLTYHVVCYGRADELKINEAYAGVFVDRDLAQWRQADCNNWSAAPDFQINVAADNNRLTFSWPETDALIVDRSNVDAVLSSASAGGSMRGRHTVHAHRQRPAALEPRRLRAAEGPLECRLLPDRRRGLDEQDHGSPVRGAVEPEHAEARRQEDARTTRHRSARPTRSTGTASASTRRSTTGPTSTDSPRRPRTASSASTSATQSATCPVTDPLAMRTDPHLLHRFDARTRLSPRAFNGPRLPGQDSPSREGGDGGHAAQAALPLRGQARRLLRDLPAGAAAHEPRAQVLARTPTTSCAPSGSP